MKKTINSFGNNVQSIGNILKYALFLQPIKHSLSKEDTENLAVINKINNDVFENFSPFMENDSVFDIFGFIDTDIRKDFSQFCDKSQFWKHVFQQDAVLFAYDKLRMLIGENNSLSVYQFCKYSSALPEISCAGLDYLLNLNNRSDSAHLKIESESMKILANKKFFSDSAEISGITSNRKRGLATLIEKLQKAGLLKALNLPTGQMFTNSGGINIHLLEFFEFALTHRKTKGNAGNSVAPIIQVYDDDFLSNLTGLDNYMINKKYEGYISSLFKLLTSIDIDIIDKIPHKTSVFTEGLALSDKIYLRYEIEKIFAPSSISCLYQNLYRNSEKPDDAEEGLELIDNSILLEPLSSFCSLPNVFTRSFILQIAMDTIRYHNNVKFNDRYFLVKLTDSGKSMVSQMDKMDFSNTYNKASLLLRRFNQFIDYMAKVAFPVYENYFFCSLWDSVSYGESDFDKIVFLYESLSHYLNNESEVKKLFDTEILIEDSITGGVKANKDTAVYKETIKALPKNVIYPNFAPDEWVDSRLFFRCLSAVKDSNCYLKSESNFATDQSLLKDERYIKDVQSLFISHFTNPTVPRIEGKYF